MSHFEIRDQQLPAGIEDKGYEFFYSNVFKNILCTHNLRTYQWEEIPEEGKEIVAEDLAKHPDRVWCLRDWNIHDHDLMLKQYVFCRFGKFDTVPDVSAEGELHDGEYFDCGLRGKCKYEGKLCATLKVGKDDLGNDVSLTNKEVEVLKLVAKGMLNKEIADALDIKENTVSTHIQNIQQKGGFFRKFEMIAFAKDKNLV